MSGFKDIEIPKRMRTLERDRRGYPIPFIVVRDKDGVPHFTINDHRKVMMAYNKRLCGICGKRHENGVWFVAGPRSFTDPKGAFIDPPAHEECARYALRVCPFLAAPSYARRIDDRTLQAGARPDDMAIVKDTKTVTDRPDKFGLGHANDFRLVPSGSPGQFYAVVDSWISLEWWRSGIQIEADTLSDR